MAEKEKDPTQVMLKGVRLNMFEDQIYYPEAERADKGKKKGCMRFKWATKVILPPKDTPEGKKMLQAIKEACIAAKKKNWGDRADEIKIKLTGNNSFLSDGDDEEVTFDAYHGSYFLSASKTVYGPKDGPEDQVPKRPFKVIGPRKVKQDDGSLRFPVMEPGQEGAPYSGCYVNMKIEVWGQNANAELGNSNRLNATILAIQFAGHGESFGGSTHIDVDDEFDEEDIDGDFDNEDDDLGGASSLEDDDELGI